MGRGGYLNLNGLEWDEGEQDSKRRFIYVDIKHT